MKMSIKKVSIVCALACVILAGVVLFSYFSLKQEGNLSVSHAEGTNVFNDETEKRVYTVTSMSDLAINNEDPEEMLKVSQYVALVHIDSVDGGNNYSEVTGEYVLPYTFGRMTILQVLSGDLQTDSEVEFYRLGGTVTTEQYYNGLPLAQQERYTMEQAVDAMFDSADYVKDIEEGDIDVEAGKTYLAYLVDETAYFAKPNTYAIIGYQGGLREVKQSTERSLLSTTVLNNFTGEWEELGEVINLPNN